MRKLNKRNAKLFTMVALVGVEPGCDCNTAIQSDFKPQQDIEQVEYCALLFSRLADFRQRRKRSVDFYYGRQLRDMVKDPDSNRDITEEDLLKKSGYPLIVTNIIYKVARTMVSQYSSAVGDPYCVARDRDEQKVGEMLSASLQYVYQRQHLQIMNTNSFLEFILSALPGWRVGCDWDDDAHENNIYIDKIDPNKIFFDNNTDGLFFDKVKTIGYVHDMDMTEVDDLCEGDDVKMNFFRDLYRPDHMAVLEQHFSEAVENKNFYMAPADKCRVIEVWFKREMKAVRYWDTMSGKIKIVPREEYDNILMENERRKAEMVEFGGKAEDAALCVDIKKFTHRYWCVRYMTPEGYIIKEKESPYWHNSHPFVLGAYPMVDGEIHSLVEISIPMQKAFNRLKQRMEFIRMASAKGVLVVAQESLKGTSLKEISNQWAKSNGVIALNLKEGVPIPQQINGNSSNVGDMEMLQMEMSLLEDITGIHRAMQGKPAQSGTPAALYALELQNSQTSTSDVVNWYNALVRKRDTKIVQLIQQYYEDGRYMNLVGKEYKEESKIYNAEKCRNAQVDVNIVEGSSSNMYRTFADGTLLELLKMGGIDIEMYLENSSAPFADRILEAINAKKKDLEKQQLQLAQSGVQMNPMIAQAMGNGGDVSVPGNVQLGAQPPEVGPQQSDQRPMAAPASSMTKNVPAMPPTL